MKAFGKIFRESFEVGNDWADWFLGAVADKRDVISIDVDDTTASVALLTPYKMEFHGDQVPVSYINSVATARRFRGRGLASQLMIRALGEAAARGCDFAVLIPANRRLFFFYDSFGFSTVFYIDEQRYTSLHSFGCAEGFSLTEPTWDDFHALESMRTGAVVHSRTDFENIITDLAMSNGKALAVEHPDGRRAMIFFEVTPSEVHVLDLLASDEESAEAALHFMRTEAPGLSVIVRALPCGRKAQLRSRGMARILNVESVLTRIAAANPKIAQTIKVRDKLLPANSGTFVLKNGRCERVSDTRRRPDLDVDIEVLCRILFSEQRIGEIFDLPTSRPFISLMLD